MEHYGRNKDKLISDVLMWTPTHVHAGVGQPAKTCIHHLCVDTGCLLEKQPGMIDDRDK